MKTSALLLMFLAPLSASAAVPESDEFSAAPVVEVTLANFKFTPSTIHLNAGQPVILRLMDVSAGGHDFAAPAFFAAARIRDSDMGTVAKGEVSLRGHQGREIALVPAAGRYALSCHHPFHKLFGMKGTIIVD